MHLSISNHPVRRGLVTAASALGATLLLSCGSLDDPVIVPIPPEVSPVPVLGVRGDTTISEGERLGIVFSATDPRDLGLVYVNGGVGEFIGDQWTWRPSLQQSGTHSVRVIVHVAGHPEWADTVDFKVVVLDDADPGPRLDFIRDTTIREGQTLALALSASDPRARGLTYSMSGPAGANLVDTIFTWTPGFTQGGTHAVRFRVVEQGLAPRRDSILVTVTVLDVDRAPVLQALRDTAIDTSQTLRITLSAVDPDGDAIAYSMLNPPSGAVLDGAAFSWKPRATQVGGNVLTFIATAKGLSDTVGMVATVRLPGQNNDVPDPLAYWSFDEGTGNVAVEAVGKTTLSLYGNPLWVDGVSGKAVRFNGTPQQYGQASISFPDMTEQTLSVWVYIDTIKYMTIVSESDAAAAHDNELSLEYLNTTGRWMYRTKDPDPKGLHYADTFGAPAPRRWYYLAGTSTGDTARIYVNGVLQRTNVSAQPFNLTGYHGPIQISAKQNYAFGVKGIVDEVKLWDKALTPQQIASEWNRHKAAAGYP